MNRHASDIHDLGICVKGICVGGCAKDMSRGAGKEVMGGRIW